MHILQRRSNAFCFSDLLRFSELLFSEQMGFYFSDQLEFTIKYTNFAQVQILIMGKYQEERKSQQVNVGLASILTSQCTVEPHKHQEPFRCIITTTAFLQVDYL